VLAKDGFWDTEDWIIHVKCCYVLVTDGEVTADEFMAALPDVDVLASLGIWRDPADSRKMNQFSRWTGLTSLVYAALALEKLGQHDAAMPYVTKALDEDQTQGGSGCRWHHAMAHCCRGRLLVAAGQTKAARAAFEDSIAVAARSSYWLLEALALRDLVVHVESESPATTALARAAKPGPERRRLARAMERLAGPKDMLQDMLFGGGCVC
jgi:tetratricopeptide (TPR) repeat protein